MSVLLIIISALRSDVVGADTSDYMVEYNNLHRYTIHDIIFKYKDYKGFYIPAWICYKLHIPMRVWLAFVSALYILPVKSLIDRYSTDKLYSFLCFVTMGAFVFSLAGLKQTVSMGLCIWAFNCVRDRRYLFSILLSLWAFLCHKTSLIFLAVLPIYLLRRYRNIKFVSVCVSFAIMFFFREIFIYLISLLNDERYMAYLYEGNIYSATTLLYYITLFIVSSVADIKQNISNNKYLMNFLFGVSIICLSIHTFAFVSASAFRLSLFFSPFFGVYITNALNNKSSVLFKVLVSMIMIIFFLYTNRNTPYMFVPLN